MIRASSSFRIVSTAAFVAASFSAAACSGGDPDDLGTGGASSTGGALGTGGSSGGALGTSGGTLGAGGAGVGGVMSGGASSGGAASGGADVGSGGADDIGSGGADVGSGGADDIGSGGADDTGSGGADDAGSGGATGVFTPSTGAERTMGYVGCSMSVNVAEGYEALGAKRLWPPIGQYNGQVVQNWANNNDSVWGAFDNAASQYGTPDDVWVMLCIFDNMVTVAEAEQIVANVRERAPNANIYITGQPVYDDPNSCFLAGDGGPDKTDRIAKETAEDTSLNIIYPGALGPLASGESSDGCHTNTQGSAKLGQQFIDWFGN